MGEHETDPAIALANEFRMRGITPSDIENENPNAANELRFLYGLADELEERISQRGKTVTLSSQPNIPPETNIILTVQADKPSEISFLPPATVSEDEWWAKSHNSQGKMKSKRKK